MYNQTKKVDNNNYYIIIIILGCLRIFLPLLSRAAAP